MYLSENTHMLAIFMLGPIALYFISVLLRGMFVPTLASELVIDRTQILIRAGRLWMVQIYIAELEELQVLRIIYTISPKRWDYEETQNWGLRFIFTDGEKFRIYTGKMLSADIVEKIAQFVKVSGRFVGYYGDNTYGDLKRVENWKELYQYNR
ncbi:MAG: hypothetical protein ACP6IU_08225 [Candidatus Asgardarchaeia archaeon]